MPPGSLDGLAACLPAPPGQYSTPAVTNVVVAAGVAFVALRLAGLAVGAARPMPSAARLHLPLSSISAFMVALKPVAAARSSMFRCMR